VSPEAASLVVVIAEGLGHLVGADGHAWYSFWSRLGAAALAAKRRAAEAGSSITLTE
jgi:hypothetical protein